MSEIATGKLVIWMRLQAKRITPDGNSTSIMLSAAADRLESQEAQIKQLTEALAYANEWHKESVENATNELRELSGITGELERFRAFHERYAEQTSKKYVNDICALTARAEKAERERDAAVNALTLYEDALFDECDKSYQSGFVDGFQSREEIDDED